MQQYTCGRLTNALVFSKWNNRTVPSRHDARKRSFVGCTSRPVCATTLKKHRSTKAHARTDTTRSFRRSPCRRGTGTLPRGTVGPAPDRSGVQYVCPNTRGAYSDCPCCVFEWSALLLEGTSSSYSRTLAHGQFTEKASGDRALAMHPEKEVAGSENTGLQSLRLQCRLRRPDCTQREPFM